MCRRNIRKMRRRRKTWTWEISLVTKTSFPTRLRKRNSIILTECSEEFQGVRISSQWLANVRNPGLEVRTPLYAFLIQLANPDPLGLNKHFHLQSPPYLPPPNIFSTLPFPHPRPQEISTSATPPEASQKSPKMVVRSPYGVVMII